MDQELLRNWKKAYLAQSRDAAVGRAYRGLIHNLNGVMQAFSMQSELILMMFDQAGALLKEAQAPDEAKKVEETIQRLEQLLQSRRRMAEQMQEKVLQGQRIMHQTMLLKDLAPQEKCSDLATLIRAEVEFFAADMFFKHAVQKELSLEDAIPLTRFQEELHQVIAALLANGLEAMQDYSNSPVLIVSAEKHGGRVEIVVQDNGRAIPPADLDRIFQPFFTTKEGGHSGLGLYLAESTVREAGGALSCESRPGRTAFRVTLPVEAVSS